MRRTSLISIAVGLLLACDAVAGEFIPVVNGTLGSRRFTTTVEIRNPTETDGSCEFEYWTPSRPERPFVTREGVPAGKTYVTEDFLGEIPTASTIRVHCSSPAIAVFSRIQQGLKGKDLDPGWLFRAFSASPTRLGGSISFSTGSNVVIAEVAGKKLGVLFTARNGGGVTFAEKSYALLPYGQRIVDLSDLIAEIAEPTVDLRVVSGDGALVAAPEARDARSGNTARRRPPDEERRFQEHSTQAEAAGHDPQPAVTQLLVMSPFKAAPFREPATGLVFMRDRWYDPSTGTFLSPDPEGYRDSPNPYIFGGGDPVNRSDPSGRAAAVSNSGWIIGQRPDGSHYKYSPEYARSHPVEVQSALESDSDLTDADVRTMMIRAGLTYGSTSLPCRHGEACISAGDPVRAGDRGLGAGLAVSNFFNATLGPVNEVNGERPFPTPDPQNDIQWGAFENTSHVIQAITVPMAIAGILPGRIPPGEILGNTYNISTTGMSAVEREAVLEYARRTNAWLRDEGAQVVRSTKGQLRRSASAAARRERLLAERAGTPYSGQVGHVPDTAISGEAVPPAGWLDMAGTSNQCCGGGLANRIGTPIRVVTVDGQVPK
ncbi:MAG: RHS repeat-associated core domain-containing protein [Thermoanaerobaculia bacterium]